MKEQRLVIYRTPAGREPFSDWLHGLKDRLVKRKVRARLARVRLGNFGDCEALGAGILELRIMHGPGFRVYFGRDGDVLVVLLCGGEKNSQQEDIERAHFYWQDYRQRKKKNGS